MAAASILKVEISPYLGDRWSYIASKFGTLTQFDAPGHSVSKIGPQWLRFLMVYALDISCSFSETFAAQNDNTAYLNLAIKQQLYNVKTEVYTHC